MKYDRKTIFLDRDGVVNEDFGYVYKQSDLKFMRGLFAGLRILNAKGYDFIIITNQSGIGRGFYSIHDFKNLQLHIEKEFRAQGLNLLHTYYCPHHPDARLSEYRKHCTCRKPMPKMFNDAIRDFNVNVDKSLMIGDKPSDIIAANSANVRGVLYDDCDFYRFTKDTVISILGE